MTGVIGPVTAADQPAIESIVRAKRVAPCGLDWPRSLVAEDGGRMVGVGQVKPHSEGRRELASLAVVPEFQGRGRGKALASRSWPANRDLPTFFAATSSNPTTPASASNWSSATG